MSLTNKDLNYLSIADLSDEEKKVLTDYKAASSGHIITGCFDINLNLEYNLHLDDMLDLKEKIITLDGVLSRSPKLKSPITVYRAINQRLHYPCDNKKKFRNKGFWSTSLDRNSAYNFLKPQSSNCSGAIFVLNLPKNFSAYNMENLNDTSSSGEDEILLQRDILWTVKNAKILDIDTIPILPYIKKNFLNIAEITIEPEIL